MIYIYDIYMIYIYDIYIYAYIDDMYTIYMVCMYVCICMYVWMDGWMYVCMYVCGLQSCRYVGCTSEKKRWISPSSKGMQLMNTERVGISRCGMLMQIIVTSI